MVVFIYYPFQNQWLAHLSFYIIQFFTDQPELRFDGDFRAKVSRKFNRRREITDVSTIALIKNVHWTKLVLEKEQ